MAIHRAPENPILRPENVRPSRGDFEVIGVFNAAVARYREEVILLLRVAERPVNDDPAVVLCPIYDVDPDEIVIRPFARDDPRYDFSDPRLIVSRTSPVSRPTRSGAPYRGRPRVSKASRLRMAGKMPASRRGQSLPRAERGDALDTQGRDGVPNALFRVGEPHALATHETYLTSISHLRLARSRDGIRFQVADAPTLGPANRYETFGIEDPRITPWRGHRDPKREKSRLGTRPALVRGEGILPSYPRAARSDPDTYYITYVGVSPLGVTTCLASTRDFESFERHGVIFHPDNKDVVLFPSRIDDQFYALHRPHSSLFLRNDIWLADSPDLLRWGGHRYLMGTRAGRWDEIRIGAGAVPFRTDKGWLELYHGADRSNRYCLGAVLLDGEQPWKILARSERPLFEPEADYEKAGFFGHVVFSCGLLFEEGLLKLYYGAADTSICYAKIPLADVYANLGL
jgi:predicted GH43/DUF377 family glycosyl hydrolase